MAIRGPFPDRGCGPRDYLLPGQIISRPLGVKTKVGGGTKRCSKVETVSDNVLHGLVHSRMPPGAYCGQGNKREKAGKLENLPAKSLHNGDERGLILQLETILLADPASTYSEPFQLLSSRSTFFRFTINVFQRFKNPDNRV